MISRMQFAPTFALLSSHASLWRLFVALALILSGASIALAQPREQAARIHDRLAGVPADEATLSAMAATLPGNPTAAANIATEIYSAPPVIRLTAHGIRSVPSESREAVESLGATRSQELFGALLPMAKRTIVLGINQTIMAALAMVTIAALIAAPGLGQVVIQEIGRASCRERVL